jgi:uncharacterized membrane protein
VGVPWLCFIFFILEVSFLVERNAWVFERKSGIAKKMGSMI